jgi:AcrR family transcriptional regulator
MPERPADAMRSDARENRARIVDTARTALAHSSDASLNSIAQSANVGIGTLYRHFPTREALMRAVYRHEIEQLAADAPTLLDLHPPLEALRLWLGQLRHYGLIKHGLSDVLHAIVDDDLMGETQDLVSGALTTLLQACERVGAIRADVEADDLLHLVGFMWRLGPEAEERASRLLEMVMDGIRPRARRSAQTDEGGTARL